MIDESNPAGRLHRILSEATEHPDAQQVGRVWASVLDLEYDDVVITEAVVELYSLSNKIQSLIKINDQLNHELYLKSFDSINRVFFPLNLSSPWSSVRQHLNDEALTRLQFCAEMLSNFYTEETLSEEELGQIITIIESLSVAVNASNLPDALRLSLLEEVEHLKFSIAMYQIKGARGLMEALKGTIGAVVAHGEELKAAADSNPDVLKRLGELIDKLDSFTSRALKLKKMLTSPIRFLLDKTSESECEHEDRDSGEEA